MCRNSFDDYLAKLTDDYLEGCINYKCEIARDEHCTNCNTYCDNYLETLSLDEIENDLLQQEIYYEDFLDSSYFKNNPQQKVDAIIRMELLKSYLKY